jgi:hypothetical protein
MLIQFRVLPRKTKGTSKNNLWRDPKANFGKNEPWNFLRLTFIRGMLPRRLITNTTSVRKPEMKV